MDFLNQAAAQFNNLFRSMSPGARIVAGLLFAAIVVSLAFLVNHQWTGPDSYLMGGEPISPDEINNITGVLGQAGLTDFVVEGGRIRVPRGLEATYTAALLDKGALPGAFGSYLQKAVSESGTFSSKIQRAQASKVAMQIDLARIIRKMRGISNAVVLYNVQEGRGFKDETKYSASVSVETTGSMQLDEIKVMAIRNLVASAVGMAPNDVVVTDLKTFSSYPATKDGYAGTQNQYVDTKIRFERLWNEKIRDRLQYIPGVIVACNVDLNKELEHQQQKTQFDPKKVDVFVDAESKSSTMQTPQPVGPPGVGSQGGFPPNQPVAARPTTNGANSNEELDRSTTRSVTSQDLQVVTMAGLTPARVTASIGIPASYIEQVWLQQNKAAPGSPAKTPTRNDLKTTEDEEIKKAQAAIAQILQLNDEAAPDPIKQVGVSVFHSLPVEEIPEPNFVDNATHWMSYHWTTLATALLGLVSLVMLRSVVRAVPAPAPIALPDMLPGGPSETAIAAAATEAGSAAKPTGPSRLRRRNKSGPSLREELVEIVREDPDAAASVLRTWINSNA
jgi:flagellar M-ring protein FliF